MNENHKLEEARYFSSRLASLSNDRRAFTFELSAFLSAARSVLQYALKEVEQKAGGHAWYSGHLSTSKTMKYFKDKRDLSIHVQPVVPSLHLHASIVESVRLEESLSVTVVDKDGKVFEEEAVKFEPPPLLPPSPPASIGDTFHFLDWSGPEDVEKLCLDYLTDISNMVADGKSKGLLP